MKPTQGLEALPEIRLEPLHPFGARVLVEDPTSDIGATISGIKGLLWRCGLLIFPNMCCNEEEQNDLLMRLIGFKPGRLHTTYISSNVRAGILGHQELLFHTEGDYDHNARALGLSLYAIEVSKAPTATLFANGRLAAANLPADLWSRLAQCTVRQVFERLGIANPLDERQWRYIRPNCSKRALDIHPITGELYLTLSKLHTLKIEGVTQSYGEKLLRDAFEHFYKPSHVLEHYWKPGDLVVWDNYSVQHARKAISFDETRTLRRIQFIWE